MIVKCKQEHLNNVLAYIGSDYSSCLYLYLDLNKYGTDAETVDVFMQKEKEDIQAVLLRYYSCLHIYSKDNVFDAEELGTFIEQNCFSMLYCTLETGEQILKGLSESFKEKASVSNGWVAQIKKIDQKPQGIVIPAEADDFEQIAELIFNDEDIGRSYDFDELALQLKERREQGYARNLVIKEQDLVIAHACTNAETDRIAIVAELIVQKEYQRKGYASEIWRELCHELLEEGKEVYSFYYSDESRNLHQKIGFFEVCKWSKIVF